MKIAALFILNLCCFTLTVYSQYDTLYNQSDKNGLKQGYWKRYMTANGKTYLYAIEKYKDNKKDGQCVYYYADGKKQSEIYYKDDTLDGMTTVYRTYGVIQYQENFSNGKTNGLKKFYNTDGALTEEQEYKDGNQTGIYRLYSKHNRVVVESYYIDGIENGTRKVYADTNKHDLIREFDFKNDIKVAARYFKNGKVVKEQRFNYAEGLSKAKELREKNKSVD